MTTTKPVLYLMVGYPGAGKTTTAKLLAEMTGAVHLWADHERRERFGQPTYSDAENNTLYTTMNQEAADLLQAGKSVVFDTGFNRATDRAHLRSLAGDANATTITIWVQVDPELARKRATRDAHLQATRALGDMSDADFDRLQHKLEPPTADESFVAVEGSRISAEYLAERLSL